MKARFVVAGAAALAVALGTLTVGAQQTGVAILSTAVHASHGTYVTTITNGQVRAVYMYTPDTRGQIIYDEYDVAVDTVPAVSRCSGGCAGAWPIVRTTDTAILESMQLSAALVGSIVRSDGTTQVTYNGWPLYRYVADGSASSTSGQGVGGVWYLLNPLGVEIGR